MLYEKQYFIAAIITLLSTWCILPSFGHNGQCIKGKYHKDKPSQETEEYKFCTPWKNLTCCTTLLDNEVDQGDAPKQYNDTWHLCGNLSPECLKYWKRQECFYQCSPYVYQWKDSKIKDAINGVPVCASECDDWYEACKSDRICVENVLEDYNQTENYVKKCPGGIHKCVNYSTMYGSGENLCNKMWGSSYKYVKKDGNNCMKFWFIPGSENPNADVSKEVVGSAPVSALSSQLLLAVVYPVIVVFI